MDQSFFDKVAQFGRICVGLALIGYGSQFFLYAHNIAALSQTWPAWLGGAPFPEFLAGALLALSGLAIISGFYAELAAVSLGSVVLLWILGLTLPPALAALGNPAPRNNVAESCGICGAVLFVGQWYARKGASGSMLDLAAEKLGLLARFIYALGLIIFGAEHLMYAQFVATLVPAWIPWHLFWSEFCGIALIAGGIAIAFNLVGALGARLTGLMILLFGILVNAPRALPSRNPDEWTSLFHTLAWSGGAFVAAAILKKVSTPKGMPVSVPA
jgi:uncharacterized membrane protein YphA (DoxX/SURF4 family)